VVVLQKKTNWFYNQYAPLHGACPPVCTFLVVELKIKGEGGIQNEGVQNEEKGINATT
jgi:hypothetical protein